MVIQNPFEARHHGRIRTAAGAIEHLHTVDLRAGCHADHINTVVPRRDDPCYMCPMPLVILTGRTSEAVEGVDRTRKVRMRQIHTSVQDRDADSTTIGGASRYAYSNHASGNDLRRASSPPPGLPSALAFPFSLT